MGVLSYLKDKAMGQKGDGASEMYDKAKTVFDSKADTGDRIASGLSLSGDAAAKLADRTSIPMLKGGLKAWAGGIKAGEAIDKYGGKAATALGIGNEGLGGNTGLGAQIGRGIFNAKNKEVLDESKKEKSFAPSNGKATWNGKDVTPEELEKLKAEAAAKNAEKEKAAEGDAQSAGADTKDGDAAPAEAAPADGAQEEAPAEAAPADGAQEEAPAEAAPADGAQEEAAQDGDSGQSTQDETPAPAPEAETQEQTQ
jgi:hypothetical protein